MLSYKYKMHAASQIDVVQGLQKMQIPLPSTAKGKNSE